MCLNITPVTLRLCSCLVDWFNMLVDWLIYRYLKTWIILCTSLDHQERLLKCLPFYFQNTQMPKGEPLSQWKHIALCIWLCIFGMDRLCHHPRPTVKSVWQPKHKRFVRVCVSYHNHIETNKKSMPRLGFFSKHYIDKMKHKNNN